MTTTVRYPSQRQRDAMLATNMARGAGESYDRLAAVLAERPHAARRRTSRSDRQQKGAVTRMSEISDRYRNVAAQFTERVKAVPDGAWANPAPCEGWVARDVVRHLTEWLPRLLLRPVGHRAAARPRRSTTTRSGAWLAVDGAIQDALDDPAVADSERDDPHGPVDASQQQVDMICTPDVLIHTWDLARAAGLDETLDPDEVARNVAGVEAMPPEVDQAMRDSGHYGPRVEVPADADAQTRLLAFMGRRT